MDLKSIIHELCREKQRLDRIIATLEQLEADSAGDRIGPTLKRRGRKSMGAEERRRVSERMKKYRAKRRGK